MLVRDEAQGVHRIEDAGANWYLIEDGFELCVVDTGLPGSWRSLHDALRELGHSPGAITAVVLTHGHFDHMGFARKAQEELRVPVWAHAQETPVVARPWHYDHERSRLPYLRHGHCARTLLEMSAMGALWVSGIDAVRTYRDGDVLEVPGRPTVVHTPGHTYGHCSLWLGDRGVVLAGDAFVMRDPYTGRAGPCIVAGAATADSDLALSSLDALGALAAEVALTGHGPPWRGSMAEAAGRARAAGAA